MKLSKQELEAVIAASPRSFVPFNKLVLSPTYQARPENPAAPLPLAELAASIDAAGLLHNLIVVRGTRGVHEVCAGGRRLRAMALLGALLMLVDAVLSYRFWILQGNAQATQLLHFMKNIGLVGGLFLLSSLVVGKRR